MAACSGFVWFRWFRPSKQHDFQRMALVFKDDSDVALLTPFDTITTDATVREFVGGGPKPFIRYRQTLDECRNCGKTRGWLQ